MSDEVSPELYAAHRQVSDGLLAIRDAVACPACYAQQLAGIVAELEALIEDAEAIAEGAEHVGAVH